MHKILHLETDFVVLVKFIKVEVPRLNDSNVSTKPNIYLITILGDNSIMDDSNVSLLQLVHHLFNTTKQSMFNIALQTAVFYLLDCENKTNHVVFRFKIISRIFRALRLFCPMLR